MHRVFVVGSCSLGGWVGWWLGTQVNIWLALMLGAMGSGLGFYLYRRYLSEYMG